MTNTISNKHKSVLLESSIKALNIKPNGVYIDMTLGRGGHSELILSHLNSEGRLISIDQDIEAIEYCQEKFKNDPRIIIVKNNFANLKAIMTNLKIDFVDGILLDLGISSPQLDNSYRGFSYKQDGPLDMRMDLSNQMTASELINNMSASELTYIFKTYGDIKQPFQVVNNIIKYRSQKPIKTTMELVEIIKNSLPVKELYLSKHPAKVYFQALRIAVNDEINLLKKTITTIRLSFQTNATPGKAHRIPYNSKFFFPVFFNLFFCRAFLDCIGYNIFIGPAKHIFAHLIICKSCSSQAA